ncbi:acetolactate synthase large subunit [Hydrogenophaga soli]
MNGAQALMKTLVDAGIDTCFSNPGTSEMHFVAALDSTPQMRAVLTLFEGVATGAADGYGRMADKPAATLLHLGCGLGNGLANLHNARKGRVPVLNIVGDHATHHVQYDAQLQSDIETVARNVSPGFVRTSTSTAALSQDALDAVDAATGATGVAGSSGQVATLILPADVSWGEGGVPARRAPRPTPPAADAATLVTIAQALQGPGRKALLLGGHALREPLLNAAARIAAQTGAKLFAEVFPTRLQRGAGLPAVERIAYLAELASVQLAGLDHLVLVDARPPVSFFAYPGKKSWLVPEGCTLHSLTHPGQDVAASLNTLVQAVGAQAQVPALQPLKRPARPKGKFNAAKVCKAVGHLLPDNAIVVDEAQTSGLMLPLYTATAPRHDLLTLTGGAIGQGLPCALGAAMASPGRQVISLNGDGSAMYTLQALWTMAREKLNVVNIVFNNRSYAILNLELQRVGATQSGAIHALNESAGGQKMPASQAQLDLSTPPLDFVRLAEGMGVPARRVDTTDGFVAALEHALRTPGPHLIEAVVPPSVTGLKLRVLPHLLQSLQNLPQPLARALKKAIAP